MAKAEMELEILVFDPNQITTFNPLKAEIAELKESSNSLVFDLTDKKQEAAARSHVAKLRKVKTRITTAKSDAKRGAIDFGKALDLQANDLLNQISEIIDFQAIPIKEFADAEEKRLADIHDKICELIAWQDLPAGTPSETYKKHLANVTHELITETHYGEFMEAAENTRQVSMTDLQIMLDKTLQAEQDARELEEHRQEKADREQRELLADCERQEAEEAERISTEATEKAQRDAAEENSRLQREAGAATERAAQARRDLEESWKQADEDAEQARLDGIAEAERLAEEKRKDEEEARRVRENDVENQRKVNIQASMDIQNATGLTAEQAVSVVKAIAKKRISNVAIIY
tara:strand:+ start:34768 stop:35814 length:1047 start_codon:yes stop_codon:yes gene_type:complete